MCAISLTCGDTIGIRINKIDVTIASPMMGLHPFLYINTNAADTKHAHTTNMIVEKIRIGVDAATDVEIVKVLNEMASVVVAARMVATAIVTTMRTIKAISSAFTNFIFIFSEKCCRSIFPMLSLLAI